jgi:hypothetical protein
MGIEALRGKPMEERAQGEIVKWGFISLLLLMAVVMVNDVSALFTGKLNVKLKKNGNPTQTQPVSPEPPAAPNQP